tara:strand:- start:2152 stop:2766 length:615 start_codon:yes stop_codon:yes gene_type:complete
MEDIEKEIQEKVIEKQPAPEPELKPKKPRSEAQKAAFEKARLKRAENLKKKQEQELENINLDTLEVKEQETPPPPKKKRGRPRGSTKAKQLEKPRLPEPVNNPVYQPVNHGLPFSAQTPQNFYQYDPRAFQPPPTPQPVNNYYYYGAPPQEQEPPQNLPRRPPTPPPEETSSEEEYVAEEYGNPEYIQETHHYQPQPKLQFRFA